MRCRTAFLPMVLAVVGGVSQTLFAASNTTVGLCAGPGTHYSTISAAVAATAAGATISICPGNYPEQVVITKALTLTGIKAGTGDAAVILPPPGGLVAVGTDIFSNPVAAQIFVQSTSGSVTIKDLVVDGTGNQVSPCGPNLLEGIDYENTAGTITTSVVRNIYQTDFAGLGGCQNGLAINVEANANPYAVTISNNSVRAYQKNGITATGSATGNGSVGPAVTISGNYIVGLGANALNWGPNAPAAENGIQVGFGATGTVEKNTVNDDIWPLDTASDTGDAASGILIFASSNIVVSTNNVGSTQFGIVTVSDPTDGAADSTNITLNKVAGDQIFDAIDACSNSNTIKSNVIYGSAESAIHLDDTCNGTGNGNSVSTNTINDACAGILLGTGSNSVGSNTYYNVTSTTLAGDVCPVPMMARQGISSSKPRSLRPSPYRPIKK